MKQWNKSVFMGITAGLAVIVAGVGVASCVSVTHGVNKLASSYTAVVADDAVASYATYREAVQLYRSNRRRALQNVSTKPGLIIPYEIDAHFLASLEAAGLSRDNIVQDKDGTFVYMIQDGDTLSQLSAAFGFSVDELASFNQIRDVDIIYANSSLRVPEVAAKNKQ